MSIYLAIYWPTFISPYIGQLDEKLDTVVTTGYPCAYDRIKYDRINKVNMSTSFVVFGEPYKAGVVRNNETLEQFSEILSPL